MKLFNRMKRETGQAMVEFALVLPIIILLIGGIVDFGWIFYNKISANNACREATRYVAVNYIILPEVKIDNAKANAIAKINENIIGGFDVLNDSVDVVYTLVDNTKPEGEAYITVELTQELQVLTPILQTFVGSTVDIDASCTMRVEK